MQAPQVATAAHDACHASGSVDVVGASSAVPVAAVRSGALGPARIAIRPEAIRPYEAGKAPAEGQLSGTISKASYLGSHIEYAVETEVGSLFVVDPRIDRVIAVGQPVTLALTPRGVIPVRD